MPRGALKSSLLLVGTLGMADATQNSPSVPPSISLRNPADLETIVGVVQTWAQAWHRGDLEAMRSCLHPNLSIVILENATGPAERSNGLMGIQAEFGRAIPKSKRRTDVSVLDVQGRCASVRADLGPWIAYLHLAAHRNGWAIANVLWEWSD
jgi:hypothetical protein